MYIHLFTCIPQYIYILYIYRFVYVHIHVRVADWGDNLTDPSMDTWPARLLRSMSHDVALLADDVGEQLIP